MSSEKNHDLALKLAVSKRYVGVEYRCQWQGYDVFEAINPGIDTGMPRYVLVKDSSARFASLKEDIAIFSVS